MTDKSVDPEGIKKRILYGVGYGKPPKATQSKKGQSGNPRGRPKKPTPKLSPPAAWENEAIMRRVLEETVKVRDNGQLRDMPKAEALQRKYEQMALSGQSVHLMRDLKKDFLAEDKRRQEQIEADHAMVKTYIEAFRLAEADAKRTRKPMGGFWIQPEDISSPTGQPSRIRGPQCAKDVPGHDLLHKLAKALLATQT